MFRIDACRVSPKYCDGQSRRSFLQLGVAGMAAVGLPQLLKVQDASAAAGQLKKDTAVILLWLDGGPGHMDMYDMKPDVPAEYRGFWTPIKTNVPGIEVTELFPLQAKIADKFSIVRSLHHDTVRQGARAATPAGVEGAARRADRHRRGAVTTRADTVRG